MTNLIIACWGGPRRLPDSFYDEHRECFIESQIEYLSQVKHNLSQITFVDNISDDCNTEDYRTILENMPDKIGNTPVKFHQRLNRGVSYGAFYFAVETYGDKFDYYIFLEDDQIIIKDHFDRFLIKEFNKNKDCGYLCAFYERGHAALSFGITSFDILKEVIKRHHEIPKGVDYKGADRCQILFSSYFEFGNHKVYDFCKKHKILYICKKDEDSEVTIVGTGKKVFMLPQQLIRDKGTKLRRIEDVRAQEWA